eukprot:gene10092-10161_t
MQNIATDNITRSDIAIAGAGIAGLTLALALQSTLKAGAKVAVIDPSLSQASGRASAIAAGPRQMLEALHVWPELKDAQPILKMVITDSRLHDPVRPVFLTFDPPARDAPFAHMVMNDELRDILLQRCRDEGVIFMAHPVRNFTTRADFVELDCHNGQHRTRLLIAADGAQSRLRDLARIPVTRHAYDQTGIVATILHERPHEGRAEEHFMADGPFAILPLAGNCSSIVWSDTRAHASAMLELDDEDFQAELERRFTLRLGALKLRDRPKLFPLNLLWARRYYAPRFALLGDAAHVIHPIAGQGLNLGLKDVACLAELIVTQMRLGLDPGSSDLLESYQKARRFDAVSMGAACDLIYRMFSNDFLPLRLIRDLGLGIVDKLPPLKRILIREASGFMGKVPPLLRGEKL